VTVVCGEHPGPGTDPDADPGLPHISAPVAAAPYDSHARMQYRRS
jgi:vanillate/3-O-methylgallate O-demethylase